MTTNHKSARQQVLDAAQYPGGGLSLVPGPLAMDHADELDSLRESNKRLVALARELDSAHTHFQSAEIARRFDATNKAIVDEANAYDELQAALRKVGPLLRELGELS